MKDSPSATRRMISALLLRSSDCLMDSATLGRVYGMAVDVMVLPDGRKVCLPGLN